MSVDVGVMQSWLTRLWEAAPRWVGVLNGSGLDARWGGDAELADQALRLSNLLERLIQIHACKGGACGPVPCESFGSRCGRVAGTHRCCSSTCCSSVTGHTERGGDWR